jgi:hypothetical protein
LDWPDDPDNALRKIKASESFAYRLDRVAGGAIYLGKPASLLDIGLNRRGLSSLTSTNAL